MASIKQQPDSQNKNASISSWGDSAEQLRLARLAMLQSEDDRDAEAYLDPRLQVAVHRARGPAQSGANMAPMGPRRIPVSSSLSSTAQGISPNVSPQPVPPTGPTEALKPIPSISGDTSRFPGEQEQLFKRRQGKERRRRAREDRSNLPTRSRNERTRNDERRVPNASHRGFPVRTPKTPKNFRPFLPAPTQPLHGGYQWQTNPAVDQRSPAQWLPSAPWVPQPSQAGPYYTSTNNPQLQWTQPSPYLLPPAQIIPVSANMPPDSCQFCRVNIAEIERTTSFRFPSACPVCCTPRALQPRTHHERLTTPPGSMSPHLMSFPRYQSQHDSQSPHPSSSSTFGTAREQSSLPPVPQFGRGLEGEDDDGSAWSTVQPGGIRERLERMDLKSTQTNAKDSNDEVADGDCVIMKIETSE